MSTETMPGQGQEPGEGTTSPAWKAPPSAPPYSAAAPASYPASATDYEAPPVPGVPVLPPGVTLAPVGRRIGAYFLSIALVIVTLVVGYVVWGLVVWGRGTTPALSVLKMRCVKVATGSRATFGTMALREIVGRLAEGILGWITELVSVVLFLARADRRCLHDLVAGTVVVLDPGGVLDRVP